VSLRVNSHSTLLLVVARRTPPRFDNYITAATQTTSTVVSSNPVHVSPYHQASKAAKDPDRLLSYLNLSFT